jgi:hypothetical protein
MVWPYTDVIVAGMCALLGMVPKSSSPRYTTLREQQILSLLDIPETISLKLPIFDSVNLNDEENKAVFKSGLTVMIKS